jgi:murein DD-endopeptidase MepM/ murein hydrolase activator NlpD
VAGLFILTGGLILTTGAPSQADPTNDKSRIDRQLAQAQATYEAATAQAQAAIIAYRAATAQLPAAQDAVAVARGVVAARQVQANEAARTAAGAQAGVTDADQRYAMAVGRVEAARGEVGTFVSAAYRGSGLLAVSSLLESRTPGDVADRVSYLEQISQSQQQALGGFVAARMRAREADNAAIAANRQADATANAASSALRAAVRARDQAAQDEAQVTALITAQTRAIATANGQRAATLAQYKAVQAESDRIAARLRSLAAQEGARDTHPATPSTAGPVLAAGEQGGGFFLTPVHGWKSSDFGMRYDPYYRVWQLHAGVDLAAPGGTPIRAAAAGRVVQTGWDGGYGNYTCLSHGVYRGRGLSTCYGHQSAVLVANGQRVQRGQVIGRVGSTGAATGTHLHFEVRVNGTPVQPLSWLNHCLC